MNKIQSQITPDVNDSLCDIRYAISNLACIRMALHGNEDAIPSTQTVDYALLAVESIIENALNKVETYVDSIPTHE